MSLQQCNMCNKRAPVTSAGQVSNIPVCVRARRWGTALQPSELCNEGGMELILSCAHPRGNSFCVR
eukprot:3550099-Prorocentrum_lima.AAC.1